MYVVSSQKEFCHPAGIHSNWAAPSSIASLQGMSPCPMVPGLSTSPWAFQSWGFCCSWGPFTNGLSKPLFRDSSSASQCQVSASLHEPVMTLKLVQIGKFLHITKGQHKVQPLLLWTTASECWPWGNTSQKIFALSMGDLSALSDQYCLSQQSRAFPLMDLVSY